MPGTSQISAIPEPRALAPEFDYDVLPSSVRTAVREQTTSIHGLLAKTTTNVIQIGLRLQFVRNRLGREHFQPWLKAEFAWSQSVASNYMRAAKTFGDLDCIEQFQPGALFVLARKRCPLAVRHEAIRWARQGKRVTKARAVELLNRWTPNSGIRSPVLAERLRKSLFKTIEKFSPDQVERLAKELYELAQRMKSAELRDRVGGQRTVAE